MLKGILMNTAIRRLVLVSFAAAMLIQTACNSSQKEWKTSNMITLTSRLQSMLERTKTVCFGRFMVDVPASATVVWGDAAVSLGVNVYPGGFDEVQLMAQKFIEELKSEKAIYHNDVPLLISVDRVSQPEGRIVTGYDGFEAINDLRINGYFKLKDDGLIIDARPLKDRKDAVIANITSIARRLRQRTEDEIPAEPGNCIEHAFLSDKPNPTSDDLLEHIRVGFRLKEFPDAHFSIYVAPSNPHDPEGDSLETQTKRFFEDPATPDEKKMLAAIKVLRRSARQIHDWHTGFEALMRMPDEDGSHAHHEFQMKFTGVPHDVLRPYADIRFQTDVANDAAGATKAGLTDEEAIAVWDKITSTIRVRPTGSAAVATSEADQAPRLLLGELAATGRVCPQTGWWESAELGEVQGGRRQHFKAGERMPRVVLLGEPSLWQRLKGQRSASYSMATMWKLVDYAPPAPPTIAQAATDTSQGQGRDDVAPRKDG